MAQLGDLRRLDTAGHRKARGAFFTPEQICSFIAAWAVRSADDRVLEPSCGEAAFLSAVATRLRELDPRRAVDEHLWAVDHVHGVELHEASAVLATETLDLARISPAIWVGDFFDFEPQARYDAVVGNPPYVRYQDFAGESRAKARERALREGVALTGLASSWAAFTVHAASMLAPGGRLGLVLPAELLTTNYAAPVRAYLMRRFATVQLVMFEARVFPGVSEEVVLLLAEGEGPTDKFTVRQVPDLDGLAAVDRTAAAWRPSPADAKWVPALLPAPAAEVYARLLDEGLFTTLDTWGKTSLGMVTGNNKYFALTREEVAEAGLTAEDLIPICPPGSRHLRGLTFSTEAWEEMAADGHRTYLFRPQQELSAAAARYRDAGEANNVHKAYKCRVRNPWWQVPMAEAPDLFLTYMNHDAPRLVRNSAGVPYLNSIHGVRLRAGHQRLGRDFLPVAGLNSMTVLGAELVGRAYGGGMLKLEPKEADALPVPSKALVETAAEALRAVRPQLGPALRGGDLLDAAALVDQALLVDGAGLKRRDLKLLREARTAMFERRAARA